ncbi:MAG TPA: molybdopterin cofactor-binding domain-containing protein [Solirubrobacteraceae bacterium]|nr:molybdopterin cofactor-binding domain-containing protein [Solirubrobacteraceae bacterium]
MANEYYSAVFLRVHPTGKMVLSLTTQPDGKEAQYAQMVADMLGVPALDVKVVPADTDRFGEGHGYNTRPSAGTQAAIQSAVGKVIAKGQRMAGMALGVPAGQLHWDGGAWVNGSQAKTLEDVALYTFGSGELPPGDEGFLDGQAVYAN